MLNLKKDREKQYFLNYYQWKMLGRFEKLLFMGVTILADVSSH